MTVCGFGITLRQLARTKKATEAVSREVKRIEFAFAKYDATVETSRAETALLAVKRGIKSADWNSAIDALESLGKALYTVRQLDIPGLSQHKSSIDDMMTHTNRLCERLDQAGDSGLGNGDLNKTLAKLRDHDRTITSLRIALQRSNLGE